MPRIRSNYDDFAKTKPTSRKAVSSTSTLIGRMDGAVKQFIGMRLKTTLRTYSCGGSQ